MRREGRGKVEVKEGRKEGRREGRGGMWRGVTTLSLFSKASCSCIYIYIYIYIHIYTHTHADGRKGVRKGVRKGGVRKGGKKEERRDGWIERRREKLMDGMKGRKGRKRGKRDEKVRWSMVVDAGSGGW